MPLNKLLHSHRVLLTAQHHYSMFNLAFRGIQSVQKRYKILRLFTVDPVIPFVIRFSDSRSLNA